MAHDRSIAHSRDSANRDKLDTIRQQLAKFDLKVDGNVVSKTLNYYESPFLKFSGGSVGTKLENVTFTRGPVQPPIKSKK